MTEEEFEGATELANLVLDWWLVRSQKGQAAVDLFDGDIMMAKHSAMELLRTGFLKMTVDENENMGIFLSDGKDPPCGPDLEVLPFNKKVLQ